VAALAEFLRSLNRRGLRGVKLVISDSHEGIKAAAFRCLKHHIRISIMAVSTTSPAAAKLILESQMFPERLLVSCISSGEALSRGLRCA